MNPDIKKRWLDALRSGKFKQGREALRSNHGGDTRHCCLGVLCELAVEDGVARRKGNRYLDCSEILPRDVQHWAELDDPNPSVRGQGFSVCLAEMNDSGKDFNAIADIIEEQL
jgi:hypothetical protein